MTILSQKCLFLSLFFFFVNWLIDINGGRCKKASWSLTIRKFRQDLKFHEFASFEVAKLKLYPVSPSSRIIWWYCYIQLPDSCLQNSYIFTICNKKQTINETQKVVWHSSTSIWDIPYYLCAAEMFFYTLHNATSLLWSILKVHYG